jgi:hypothetical protein
MIAALLVAFAVPPVAALAAQQQMGTPKQRAACRSDVKKFCKALGPGADGFAYLNCLQANRPKLKPLCRAVIDGKVH